MIGQFRVRPAQRVGRYEIVATVDVGDPRDGHILYRAGEAVPSSEVGSKAEAELWVEDLNRRYAKPPAIVVPFTSDSQYR